VQLRARLSPSDPLTAALVPVVGPA
jgi:hypothetical protein